MSQEEFKNTKFTGGMRCLYNGDLYRIVCAEFDEAIFGIVDIAEVDGFELTYVRCESIKLIK